MIYRLIANTIIFVFLAAVFSSCVPKVQFEGTLKSVENAALLASNITPPDFLEDTQSIINLSYSESNNLKATNCEISSVSNVTLTVPCSCDGNGLCSVGVTGAANFNGVAGFSYQVTVDRKISNLATAVFTISPASDAPVAFNITPANFNEDTQSIVTLSYSDVDNDLATSCELSGLSNVTVTQACSCDVAGVCSVGIKGVANYNGAAGFSYTATAAGTVSNSATANFLVNSINDLPLFVKAPISIRSASLGNVISSTSLNASDVEDNATQLIFTLKRLPSKGNLKLNGATLILNDTFTLDDILSGRFKYDHTALDEIDDSIDFSLQDSGGVYAAGATGTVPATLTFEIDSEIPLVVNNGDGTYTFTLQPGLTTGNDTYTHANTPSINYGTSAAIVVGNGIVSSAAYDMRPHLSMNLAALPSNAILTAASIKIYLYGHGTCCNQDDTISLYSLASSINELTLTHATRPSQVTTLASTNLGLGAAGYGWKTFTGTILKDFVQTRLASTKQIDFAIKHMGSNWRDGLFYSSEYPVIAMRPYIQITYTLP